MKGTTLQKANIKTKESGVEHLMGRGICSTGGKQASRRLASEFRRNCRSARTWREGVRAQGRDVEKED